MEGQFSLSIIEILGYFVPGVLFLLALIHEFTPMLQDAILDGSKSFVLFIISGYVLGHLISYSSIFVSKARKFIYGRFCKNQYYNKYDFYEKLKIKFEETHDVPMDIDEIFYFSRLLVADNLPKSSVIIEKLYSITHFCRNLVLVFLVISIMYVDDNALISVLSLLVSLAFFVRYVQLGRSTTIVTLRSAYNYFVLNRHMAG